MKTFLGVLLLSLSSGSWSKSHSHSIELLKNPDGKKMTLQSSDVHQLERLEKLFMSEPRTPGLSAALRKNAMIHRQKAVPILVKVMKDAQFPEQNRWQATMLLAQVMGKPSAPFIAKFTDHPHWMMRLASLKALLGLKQDQYVKIYAKALKDPSLIVRLQALDNISQMKIRSLASQVWAMMYDQSNYSGEAGNRKRTSIVKAIIRTVGDLKHQEAQKPLAQLIQKTKYQDLLHDLDYSLEKITGRSSPDSPQGKRKFWSQLAVKSKL